MAKLQSVKLAEHYRLGENVGKEINRLIRMAKKSRSYESIDEVLEKIDKLLKGYGVESIQGNDWVDYYLDIALLYVNMGDTYAPTVLYDTVKDRWIISSWGDFVEGHPKRFER